mmetsp:Transcript_20941/g.42856  ORF Transcript_20941/g.42856 Transcript_20941/m.42856 type:complete len:276 (-) Transcript_20941:96-923(-)
MRTHAVWLIVTSSWRTCYSPAKGGSRSQTLALRTCTVRAPRARAAASSQSCFASFAAASPIAHRRCWPRSHTTPSPLTCGLLACVSSPCSRASSHSKRRAPVTGVSRRRSRLSVAGSPPPMPSSASTRAIAPTRSSSSHSSTACSVPSLPTASRSAPSSLRRGSCPPPAAQRARPWPPPGKNRAPSRSRSPLRRSGPSRRGLSSTWRHWRWHTAAVGCRLSEDCRISAATRWDHRCSRVNEPAVASRPPSKVVAHSRQAYPSPRGLGKAAGCGLL